MQHGLRRATVPARVLVALLVVLTLTSCMEQKRAALPPAPSISAVPQNVGVDVNGLPDGEDFEVTDTSEGVENGANLDFVSPVFTVEPAGELAQPVTVTVDLDNALPADTPIVVATRVSDDQPWTFKRATLSSDQQHVEYTTTSLNQLGVLSVNLDSAVAGFQADVPKSLATGVSKKVKQPSCDGRPEARETGYSVTATKGKALHWCFGLEDDKRVLKVTNRLVTPIQIAHAKVEALKTPAVPGPFTLFTGVLGKTDTFLAPGRTAVYDADLEPVTALMLSSDANATMQSLRLLRATTHAIVTSLVGFDQGPVNVNKTLTALLAMPQCRKSLGKGSDALIAGCFSTSKLTRLFGSRALLVAPLFSAPTSQVFFREQAVALASAQPAAQQRIDVKRVAPDFSAFIGLWSGKTRNLVIGNDGLGTETVFDAMGKMVITLSYQLGYPDAKTGATNSTTSADTKITKVRVGRPKLVRGRVPRVGAEGTIRITKGVVDAPYLNVNYCDTAKARKGVCGK